MKTFILTVLLTGLLSSLSFSQTNITAPNSLHLELLGNGLIYSLNYERMIVESFGARIGIGYLQVKEIDGDDQASLTTVPVMVTYLLGSKSSKLELGVGICYINISADIEEFLGVEESETLGTATFGYRYQRSDGGLLFRIGVTPFFGSIGFQLSGAVGFGFAF